MLISALAGRVWQAEIDRRELDAARTRHAVIANRLRSGRTVIRVLADASPGIGFHAVEPGLEDVYFSTLHRERSAAAAAEPRKAA